MKHQTQKPVPSFRSLTTSVALPWGEALILFAVALILMIGG